MATARKTRKVEVEVETANVIELPEVVAPVLIADPPAIDWNATITADLDSFDGSADKLHGDVVEFVDHLRKTRTPSQIKSDATLRLLLSRNTRGLDRQQLATWLEAHTPIKIRLEKGGLESLNVCMKKAARRESDGLPRWDIEGLRRSEWWNAEKKAIAPPKRVELDKVKTALAKSVAKIAAEAAWSSKKGNAEEIIATLAELAKLIESGELMEAALEVTTSEKFDEWATKRRAEIARQNSIDGQERAEAERAEAERKAALAKALAETRKAA